MSASAKFYSVFVLVLAAIVGISFFVGYKAGFHAGLASAHARHTIATHAAP